MAETESQGTPDVMDEIMEEMPKQIHRVQQTMLAYSGRLNNSPIPDKLNEEHITKLLDNQKAGMEYQFKDNSRNRLMTFAVILVIAVLIALILFFFKDRPEMIEKIIVPVTTGIGGALGGYGYGKSKRAD